MIEKNFRLLIGTFVPPIVAAFSINLVFEYGLDSDDQFMRDSSWLIWAVFILGFIPSLLYSLAMEHIFKEEITKNNSKAYYLFISAALGGCAASIPFFGPWVILGILIGLGVGYVLMKSVIREQASECNNE